MMPSEPGWNMDRSSEMSRVEDNKNDPQPLPECPPYPVYPMTYIDLDNPPPYSFNPNYNGTPQLYPNAPPTYVVTSQPYTLPYQPQPDVKDYLYWSIANMLCCNPILGILALVFSAKTLSAIRYGYSSAASAYSRTALTFNIMGVILGICTHVFWISWIIYWAVTEGTKSGSFHSGSHDRH